MGILSRVTAFVAWVLTPERLEAEAAGTGAPASKAGTKAQPRRSFLRTVLASEILPLDPPTDQKHRDKQGLGAILHGLFVPEALPLDEPSPATMPGRRGGTLSWLTARETLPLDESPAAAGKRHFHVSLRWLFSRDHLEHEPPKGEQDPARIRP